MTERVPNEAQGSKTVLNAIKQIKKIQPFGVNPVHSVRYNNSSKRYKTY